MEIKGRDLREGIPKTIVVDDQEIREALEDVVAAIVNAVRIALEKTPPELSADIIDRGIVLTGGGALLKNLDKRLREETQLPVFRHRRPPDERRPRSGQAPGRPRPAEEDRSRLAGRERKRNVRRFLRAGFPASRPHLHPGARRAAKPPILRRSCSPSSLPSAARSSGAVGRLKIVLVGLFVPAERRAAEPDPAGRGSSSSGRKT